jgi:UDP-N-acetylmuramoyl-L-alanyl-D-glutamate--2,6-diaminopimelate ligase
MSMQTLLEGWCDTVPDVVVTGIELDSRRIGPGQAFIAVEGASTHGMVHVAQALARGANAVIHDGLADVPELGIPSVAVPDLGKHLSSLGARFYHSPSDHLTVAGVTGTNGKTSTAHYIAQAWQRTTRDAGIIGTIGYGPLQSLKSADMTTPDPISLQAMLSECIDEKVEKVAMEVSSHALDQGRCDDVAFDVAVFTNLSRDHLDYHLTMEAYAQAKRRLFIDCHPRFAVINHDDAEGKYLVQNIGNGTEVFSYGTNGASELRGSVLQMDSSGMTLSLASPWGGGEVRTGLLGAFNLSNLLAAAGTLALLGMPWSQVMHQLEIMQAVPGRMNCIGGDLNQPVVVDLHGRLICVFGCGGERDTGKRPMMAQVAESLADRIVLTSDNPRGEDPADIFSAMLAGLDDPGKAQVIEDRAAAIRQAVLESDPGDIVLVAGKGHEAWQEANGQKIPFSDEAAVSAALGDAA